MTNNGQKYRGYDKLGERKGLWQLNSQANATMIVLLFMPLWRNIRIGGLLKNEKPNQFEKVCKIKHAGTMYCAGPHSCCNSFYLICLPVLAHVVNIVSFAFWENSIESTSGRWAE